MTVSQQKYCVFERSLCRISCFHIVLVNVARSLCCLHRAKALVPYDEHGRRCSGEKMWLNLQVIIAILEAKAIECQGWWKSETRKWARPQRHPCLHHNCASHRKVGCSYVSFLFTKESVTSRLHHCGGRGAPHWVLDPLQSAKVWPNFTEVWLLKITTINGRSLWPKELVYITFSISREKERLRRPGPKFGTVVKIWAENCAFEVLSGIFPPLSLPTSSLGDQ